MPNITEQPDQPKPRPAVRRTLRLYWDALRRYRWWLVLHLSTVALAVMLQNILAPWLLSRGIKALPEFLNTPGAVFWSVFGAIIIGYIITQAAQWVLWRISGVALIILQGRLNRDLEQRVFNHLTKLSYRFFANSFGGALVAQSSRFVGASERLYDTLAFEIMPLILKLTASFAIVWFFAPTIALIILGFSAFFIATIAVLFTKKMPYSKAAAAAQTTLTARLADSVTNMSAIKYFAREQDEIAEYRRGSQHRYRVTLRDWQLSELIIAWQALLLVGFETTVFVLALNMVATRQIDLGQLVLTQAFVWGIFGSLWSVGRTVRNIERSFSDAAEMTQLLHTEPEVKDDPAAQPTTIERGEVGFKHMTFSYHENKKRQPVFRDLNLIIKPGEKVGLVGPSGGGKTTITKLLLRLMDIDDGQILLDGHDIARMRQTDVRRAISYVPQEPLLFHRSLRENIAYGRPGATDDEMHEAARQAHAAEFIERLPEGYGTMVGERGIKLSGGQRQRVAIARAMLKDAPVLVLDEATSALDSESERLIQDALWRLMEGRTAIVIAHRLSTIARMDRIVVLDEGAIAEQGSHTELLATDGVYSRLWSHQSGGFIDDSADEPAGESAPSRELSETGER